VRQTARIPLKIIYFGLLSTSILEPDAEFVHWIIHLF